MECYWPFFRLINISSPVCFWEFYYGWNWLVLKNRIVLYLPWFQSSFYSGLWTTNTVFQAAGKSMDCPLELYSACVRAHISECDDCHCQSFGLYIENFTEKIIPPKKLIQPFSLIVCLIQYIVQKTYSNPWCVYLQTLSKEKFSKKNLVEFSVLAQSFHNWYLNKLLSHDVMHIGQDEIIPRSYHSYQFLVYNTYLIIQDFSPVCYQQFLTFHPYLLVVIVE